MAKKTKSKSMKKRLKPESYFYLCDGKQIKNLMEMAESLETISDDIFYHHVNDMKNDFANWIENVFEDKKLAKQLNEEKDPQRAQIIILKYLVKNKR